MTIQQDGITIDLHDGFVTKEEALKDYSRRLGLIAVVQEGDEKSVLINYNDGRRAVVTI